MFAKTIPLDDIVDRAHELLIESVSFLLVVPPLSASANPKSQANSGILTGASPYSRDG
jgi:stearoyl-CoA desaturase (delta-9 desaturase)